MAICNYLRKIMSPEKRPWGTRDFAPEWTPALIDTGAWFDASDSETIILDSNDNVEEWRDKSGNARHVSQASASNMPGYEPTGHYVDFTSGTAYLFNTAPFMYHANQCAVYCVLDTTINNLNDVCLSETNSTNIYTSYAPLTGRQDIARGTFVVRDDVGWLVHSPGDYDYPDFWGGKHIRAFRDYGIEHEDYTHQAILSKNGAGGNYANYNRDGFGSTVYVLTLHRFCIGGQFDTSFNSAMNFKAHEILILETVPSRELERKIEGYFAHKWNLSGMLNPQHPYKAYKPRV